jgi:hypothetical protein
MELEATLGGIPTLRAQLRAAAQKFPHRVAGGVYRVCDGQLMPRMKEDTPVDTGDLKNSGHTQLPVIEGHTITVTMGFGGGAVDYAVYVHENLEARHNVGRAKFMERVLLDTQDQIPAMLLAEIEADGGLAP